MGHGIAPPGIDLDRHGPIDDGTLPRIGSPPPGTIDLDAKDGSAKGSTSLPERVLSYTRRQRGTRVGDGECFTLAHRALRSADARSAEDYGTVTPNADYVWGAAVTLATLQPGDIIQFRDYEYERETVTDNASGTRTQTHSESRPHHTAIVLSVDGNGAVTVLEQNAPPGSAVVPTQLYFSSGTTTSGDTTTTVTVRGTFWFYRAQPR